MNTILNQQRKGGESKLDIGKSRRWITLLPFVLQVFVTIGIVEYFTVRNLGKNADVEIAPTLNDASQEVLLDLNKYLENAKPENLDKIYSEPNQLADRKLNDLLQQLESKTPFDRIALVRKNGSIVAGGYDLSNFPANSPQKSVTTRSQLVSSSDGGKIQNFSLVTARTRIVGQIASLSDNRLKEQLRVVAIVQQPRTANDTTVEQNKLRIRYLSYLLPTTIVGIFIGLWLEHSIKNSSKSEPKAIAQQRSTDGGNYIESTLIADLSHELRSPLNAILGFAQIMQHSLSDRSRRENLAIINRNGKQLLSIINELVDLSKIEIDRLSLEKRSFGFDFWLDSLEQNLKFQAREREIAFSIIRETKLPEYICLDELRLRQIISNLLDYSMGYSQTKIINLRVSCPSQSAIGQVNILLEVENYGLVIAPENIAGLFNPAIQAQQDCQFYPGSSLSLPVSRKLARLMGGDITVHHKDCQAQSTSFRIDLKAEIVSDRDLQIQSAPREISGLELNQPDYRILIVDDSKTNRKIMVQLLERVGFQVREAVNGQEAVDEWLRWQPHMIWMDLRMPVMNGYEATEQIKSRSLTSSPAIIALTASTSEEERSLFKESGCDDFVDKPVAENIIFDKIAQHLGVRYVYHTTVALTKKRYNLTGDRLQVMSEGWIEQIEQAAASLDTELLTVLFEQIPPEHSDLTAALQKLVDNFDFDKILRAIEQSKSKSTKY